MRPKHCSSCSQPIAPPSQAKSWGDYATEHGFCTFRMPIEVTGSDYCSLTRVFAPTKPLGRQDGYRFGATAKSGADVQTTCISEAVGCVANQHGVPRPHGRVGRQTGHPGRIEEWVVVSTACLCQLRTAEPGTGRNPDPARTHDAWRPVLHGAGRCRTREGASTTDTCADRGLWARSVAKVKDGLMPVQGRAQSPAFRAPSH